MDKNKIIYIGSLLILTVIVSITYFSYAFFTNRTEQRGKLNIVTGTLDYKIKSSDLTNNSITLEANKSKQIEIEITSLNKISSKYELYYQTTASNIVVGYGSSNDTPTGTINGNGKKTVKLVIKNKSNSQATIVFGVEGGFINNTLVLSAGNHITDVIDNICNYNSGYVWNFPFDPDGDGQGQVQEFEVPCDGNYQLEVWGASGGDVKGLDGLHQGGYGGYSTGTILAKENDTYYIVVGGGGSNSEQFSIFQTIGNGYNGGGGTALQYNEPVSTWGKIVGASGGGATHIAYDSGLLSELSSHKTDNRILIVAGGGGGATDSYSHTNHGGNGGNSGGLQGNNGVSSVTHNTAVSTGGTQETGGTNLGYSGSYSTKRNYKTAASFGLGCDPLPDTGTDKIGYLNVAGGGGWYGGGCGIHGGGAGGSSYIGNLQLTNKKMVCYNCTTSTNVNTYTESNTCVNENPLTDCSKEGNGYARITYLGE